MFLFFDYGYKDTAAFSYFQIFFNFFILFFIVCNHTYIYRFFRLLVFLSFPVVVCSGGPVLVLCWSWSCVLMTIYPQSDARAYIRAYIRAYTRARTGIFRP